MNWVLCILLVCLTSFAATPALDKQLKDQRRALAELERELAEQRKALAEIQHKESGVLKSISVLDQNLGQTREYVLELKNTANFLTQRTQVLKKELDSLTTELAQQQNAMRKRIRILYMQGRHSESQELIKLIQQEETPGKTIYLVNKLLQEDKKRVDQLSKVKRNRAQKQNELNSRLIEVSDLEKKKVAEEAGLQGQIQQQQTALGTLRDDKETQQRALEEFEQNQRTMSALIKSLEERRKKEEEARKARILAARKAREEKEKRDKKLIAQGKKPTKALKPVEEEKKLVLTISGPKCLPHNGKITSRFGLQEHAVLHTMTRNLGIEIKANRGEAIKSAANGEVVAVQTISGRGLSIIIQHGENTYTVYGHLKSVKVNMGQEVNSCQVIGEAGDDESLNGPKLYFQVSQGVQAVDPLQWLGSSK